ncbi:MAG TPA: DUF2690 domain-containing protein [Actinophytocola sp.]|jgi:hypothetical protein|uniref:DUF2690 domain-containing protein n=1 Tax=Actinophytocola sp. TaxID=1872138 RepID=UPI002DFF5D88|nr:DUF2690 domain-containing protein [Actinophytocola sp.]
MSTALRRTASVTGSAAIVGASLLFDGSVAQAAPYDGTDPQATGCSNTGRVVRQAPLANEFGGQQGTVYLYYSTACRTVWAKVVTGLPECIPGLPPALSYCAAAFVHRNSDGAQLRCDTPAGASSCYTRQLNDANVTSFAKAVLEYGTGYSGVTGSY